mmetsp:Transcript_14162/g.14261  ORF Transcript_14162/g.14261 Transcript_14162/m.14261 type:complete len:196 (-) Transcript_14162:57-644(-)
MKLVLIVSIVCILLLSSTAFITPRNVRFKTISQHKFPQSNTIIKFSDTSDTIEEEGASPFTDIARLCLGQSILLLAAVTSSTILGRTDFGFGPSFHLDAVTVTSGVLAGVPLLLLGLLSEKFREGNKELGETSQVTESVILKLLGPKRNIPLAIFTGLALGLSAGLSEELLFRGLLQDELSHRFGTALSLTSVSL